MARVLLPVHLFSVPLLALFAVEEKQMLYLINLLSVHSHLVCLMLTLPAWLLAASVSGFANLIIYLCVFLCWLAV